MPSRQGVLGDPIVTSEAFTELWCIIMIDGSRGRFYGKHSKPEALSGGLAPSSTGVGAGSHTCAACIYISRDFVTHTTSKLCFGVRMLHRPGTLDSHLAYW